MPKAEKPAAKEIPVTIRFPPDVHAEMTKAAEADDRSINLYVVRAVKAQIERESSERSLGVFEKKKGGR